MGQYVYQFAFGISAAQSGPTRWEILPRGKVPAPLPEGFNYGWLYHEGASGSYGRRTYWDDGDNAFGRTFLARLLQLKTDVVSVERAGGDPDVASTIASQWITYSDADADVQGGEIVLSGGANNNIIGLGFSDDVTSADGGAGDDTFIITRYQYGDVTIDDDTFSIGNKNRITFDYDVTITGYSETDDAGDVSVELTLGTGAVVTIENPDDNFEYQLRKDDDKTYEEFKTEIGASGTDILADDFNVGDTELAIVPTVADTPTATTEIEFYGGNSEDLFTAATDAEITALDGLTGNDVFVITRFQHGDVHIDDLAGFANLIKFESGVTITSYHEREGFFGVYSVDFTLVTGAVITITSPTVGYFYQVEDYWPWTYEQLIDALNGDTPHVSNTDLTFDVPYVVNNTDGSSPLTTAPAPAVQIPDRTEQQAEPTIPDEDEDLILDVIPLADVNPYAG